MRKLFTRFISAFLILILVISPTISISAQERLSKAEQIEGIVSVVTNLLRDSFKDQYIRTEKEIRRLIVEGGYDYALTMETFYEQPKPYVKADFIEYLAIYMSCKKYASEHSLYLPPLTEIPFITYATEEYTDVEYLPLEVDNYVKDSLVEDEYWRRGTKFILAPEQMPVYVQQQNGKWKKTGESILVTPTTKDVKYLEVTLDCISADELTDFLGINVSEIEDDIKSRSDALRGITTNEAISSAIALSLPTIEALDSIKDLTIDLSGVNETRRLVVETAMSLIGKVPYEWGGKPRFAGYDTRWWTFNEKSGIQHGLDCSGFVQWAFITSGITSGITKQMISTSTILSSDFEKITSAELQPGDIGVTNRGSNRINHTGIYVGDGKWVHCSSGQNTVVVADYNFTEFFSPYESITEINETTVQRYLASLKNTSFVIPTYTAFTKPVAEEDKPAAPIAEEISTEPASDISEEAEYSEPSGESPIEEEPVVEGQDTTEEKDTDEHISEYNISKDVDTDNSIYYTHKYDQDVKLLAQLMTHEALNEGMNGWIAVGEVVMNRVASDIFPNSIKDVVYQPGQFSSVGEVSSITPSNEMLTVARMIVDGSLKVLNEPNVLYFRNPTITNGISADTPSDWGEHKWFTAINKHAFYLQ